MKAYRYIPRKGISTPKDPNPEDFYKIKEVEEVVSAIIAEKYTAEANVDTLQETVVYWKDQYDRTRILFNESLNREIALQGRVWRQTMKARGFFFIALAMSVILALVEYK